MSQVKSQLAISQTIRRRQRTYLLHDDQVRHESLYGSPKSTCVSLLDFDDANDGLISSIFEEAAISLGLKTPCLGLAHVASYEYLCRREQSQGEWRTIDLKASSILSRNKNSMGTLQPPVDGILCLTQAALEDHAVLFEEISQCIWVPASEVDPMTFNESEKKRYSLALYDAAGMTGGHTRWTRIRCHRRIYTALLNSQLYKSLAIGLRQRTRSLSLTFDQSCNSSGSKTCGC